MTMLRRVIENHNSMEGLCKADVNIKVIQSSMEPVKKAGPTKCSI